MHIPENVLPVVVIWKQQEHELPDQSNPDEHLVNVAFSDVNAEHPGLKQTSVGELEYDEDMLKHVEQDWVVVHDPQVSYIQKLELQLYDENAA